MIHMYCNKYKNRNATLYYCTSLNFDNLKELIQFTLFTLGNRQNFKCFCFSTIIEKIQRRVGNVRNVCIMCPDTSKPGQLSQVTNQFISRCFNSATRHFYSLQRLTQRNIRNKHSSNSFKLQAPSDPEVFSRSLTAAAAEALSMGRFGFLRPSSTSLSRQLWAYSRRSSSASAWSFGNQTATATSHYTIGSLSRNSGSSNLIGKK